MGVLTGFLFARPSLIEGIARMLDFGNTLCEYNRSPAPEQADAYALNADWRMIGQDILAVVDGHPTGARNPRVNGQKG